MLVKIEARILIFPGTDFHFPSTSVPACTFLGCDQSNNVGVSRRRFEPSTQRSNHLLLVVSRAVFRASGVQDTSRRFVFFYVFFRVLKHVSCRFSY